MGPPINPSQRGEERPLIYYRNISKATATVAMRRVMAANASMTKCLFMVVAHYSRWTNNSAVMVEEKLGDPLDYKEEG